MRIRAPRTLAIAIAMSFVAGMAAAQSFEGDWEGVLDTGQEKLRGVVHVLPQASGLPKVTLDSLDQNVFGVTGEVTRVDGGKVEMQFPPIGATLAGDLSPDGKTFNATYSQNGASFPLVLTRAAAKK